MNSRQSVSPHSPFRIGIDLVEIARLERIFAGAKTFQESVFTPAELQRSLRQTSPFQALAACFAAKEAFFKAFGTSPIRDMSWREVEAVWSGSGRGALNLYGKTAELAREAGLSRSFLSGARTDACAVAVVVLETEM